MDSNDVKQVGFSETRAPLDTSNSLNGAKNILSGFGQFVDLFGQQEAKEAAVANGKLVNEFLGQRIDAALETEGFADLSEVAKDPSIRDLDAFNGFLEQAVATGGASKFTEAEIKRTLIARREIAANPANAEAIIKAAGLADNVAGSLGTILKDEETARRENIANIAANNRKEAIANGYNIPTEILQDDRKLNAFAETDAGYVEERRINRLLQIAAANDAEGKATKPQRVQALLEGANKLNKASISLALELDKASGSLAEKAAAFEQAGEIRLTNLLTAFPNHESEEAQAAIARHNVGMDVGRRIINKDLSERATDLYLKSLTAQEKKARLIITQLDAQNAQDFSRANAALGNAQKETTLAVTTAELAQVTATAIEGRFGIWADTSEKGLKKQERALLNLDVLTETNGRALRNGISATGSPTDQAFLQASVIQHSINNDDPTILNEILSQPVNREFMQETWEQAAQDDPTGHRVLINNLAEGIREKGNIQDLVVKSPHIVEALLPELVTEARFKVQESLIEAGAIATDLLNFGVADQVGRRNVAKAADNFGARAGNFVLEQISKFVDNDSLDVAVKQDAKDLAAATKALMEGDKSFNLFSSVGNMMVVDLDSLSRGTVNFQLAPTAQKFWTPEMIFEGEQKLRRLNIQRGPLLFREVDLLHKAHGGALSMEEALESVLGLTPVQQFQPTRETR